MSTLKWYNYLPAKTRKSMGNLNTIQLHAARRKVIMPWLKTNDEITQCGQLFDQILNERDEDASNCSPGGHLLS